MRENFSIFFNPQAPEQLFANLIGYKNRNCSIILLSTEGLSVGISLKKHLDADLTFFPVELIKDPLNPEKSIGEVSFDFTITHTATRDIPQNFIYHQGRKLRNDLISRYQDVYNAMTSRIKDRTVIVIGDAMSPTHRIIACLKSIQRKKPGRIIVALPKKIDEDTENEIRREMDELITTETVIEEQYIE